MNPLTAPALFPADRQTPTSASLPQECPSCRLPGDGRSTPGGTVLLEHNDPAAPLTAADVPADYAWATTGSVTADRLPRNAGSETVCQIEHRLVCPNRPSPAPLPPRLLQRLRLNQDRAQCAHDRHQEDEPDPWDQEEDHLR